MSTAYASPENESAIKRVFYRLQPRLKPESGVKKDIRIAEVCGMVTVEALRQHIAADEELECAMLVFKNETAWLDMHPMDHTAEVDVAATAKDPICVVTSNMVVTKMHPSSPLATFREPLDANLLFSRPELVAYILESSRVILCAPSRAGTIFTSPTDRLRDAHKRVPLSSMLRRP